MRAPTPSPPRPDEPSREYLASFRNAPLRDRLALVLGGAFLLLQLGLIAESRLGEDRHFCWAPHTSQVEYSLEVEVDGRRLRKREIGERYGLLWHYGWEVHSVENVKQLIGQYERTYGRGEDGRGEGARVEMTYSVNGGPREIWRWPEETGLRRGGQAAP